MELFIMEKVTFTGDNEKREHFKVALLFGLYRYSQVNLAIVFSLSFDRPWCSLIWLFQTFYPNGLCPAMSMHS